MVLPCSMDKAPYLNYYIDICNKQEWEYRVLVWERDDRYPRATENILTYFPSNKLQVIWGYLKFVRNTYRHLNNNSYDCIIIYTLPLLFLFRNLFYRTNIKIIVDIRDYNSIYRLCPKVINKLLNKSTAIVISSAGFRTWLPKGLKYVESPNIRLADAYDALFSSPVPPKSDTILTIGQIRDYKININLLKNLTQQTSFKLKYCGYGGTYDLLKKYAYEQPLSDLEFAGRYMKNQENALAKDACFINAVTPNTDTLSKSLLTNRLYLAACNFRPVIVSSGTYQGHVVNKYNLGVVINPENLEDMGAIMKNFTTNNKFPDFVNNCKTFLRISISQIEEFESILVKLL